MTSSRRKPWEIPGDWEWALMGDVAEVVGGGTPRTKDPENFEGGAIPWVTPADLSGYTEKYIARGARSITEKGLDSSAARLMPSGTVLFSSRAPIGYVAIAANEVATNQGFKSFVLQPGLDPSYVYHYLHRAKELAVELASGTTFKEISGKKAAKIPIPVPPGSVQRQIVEAIETHFTRLDAAVASLERARANLKRYRASVLQAAVEGRLVPTEAELARREGRSYEPASVLLERILAERRRRWEEAELEKLRAKGKEPKGDGWKKKYKEPAPPDVEGLPELPEGWCWTTVEQLALVVSGQTPRGITEVLSDRGDVPWFRVGDMNTPGNRKFMRHSRTCLAREDARLLGLHVRPAGTIVFPKRGGAIGTNKKRLLAFPSSYDLNIMGLIADSGVAAYLWLWFNRVDLATLADGSNVPQINHGDVAPLPVPLPPLLEQRRLAEAVDDLVSVNDKLDGQLEVDARRCCQLRQAVLKFAFEGRLLGVLADQGAMEDQAQRRS